MISASDTKATDGAMLATMVLFYEQPCAKRAAVKGVRKK